MTMMDNFAEAWVAAASRQNGIQEGESMVRSGSRNDVSMPLLKRAPPIMSPDPTPSSSSSSSSVHQPGNNTSTLGVRSLTIHCIVRRSDSEIGAVVLSESSTILRDTYTALPGNMLFKDIVRGSLVKMGFPSSEAIGAKGFIQMRNWKPLFFSSVADSPTCTIEDILSDVTSTVTLIICLSRISLDDVVWTDEAVRSAVFMLLKEVSQTTLSKMSPLPQSMISNIINSKYTATISSSTCAEFGLWYRLYRRDHEEPHVTSDVRHHSRQTFHSSYELPLMRGWYQECPCPTDERLNSYLSELNASPMRQERGTITLTRLRMWWRNEKQRTDRRLNISKVRPRLVATADGIVRAIDGPLGDQLPRLGGQEVSSAQHDGAGGLREGRVSGDFAPQKKRRRRRTRAQMNNPTWTQDAVAAVDKYESAFAGFGNMPPMFDLRNVGPFDLRNGEVNLRNDNNSVAASHGSGINMKIGNDMRGVSVGGLNNGGGGGIQRPAAMGGIECSREMSMPSFACPSIGAFDMAAASAIVGGLYPRASSSLTSHTDTNQRQTTPLSLIRSNWN